LRSGRHDRFIDLTLLHGEIDLKAIVRGGPIRNLQLDVLANDENTRFVILRLPINRLDTA
jgi:hypothetical protein